MFGEAVSLFFDIQSRSLSVRAEWPLAGPGSEIKGFSRDCALKMPMPWARLARIVALVLGLAQIARSAASEQLKAALRDGRVTNDDGMVACHLLQVEGRRSTTSPDNPGTVADQVQRCFPEVRQLMPFDAKLNLRQLQKMQLFTEAAASHGGAEGLLHNESARKRLAAEILERTAANGTEAACGPTVSWLAELHLGVEEEMLLGIPTVGTWPLWQTRADVLGNFSEKRDAKDELFWYMMTSGSHTQHVWAIVQYPASPEQNLPVRYRVLQSCFDQYTLSAWLDPNPHADLLIRKRDVYAPQNRTLEYGGPGYWIKMQRPATEGGYDFASTGECVMQPRQTWPAKLRPENQNRTKGP